MNKFLLGHCSIEMADTEKENPHIHIFDTGKNEELCVLVTRCFFVESLLNRKMRSFL